MKGAVIGLTICWVMAFGAVAQPLPASCLKTGNGWEHRSALGKNFSVWLSRERANRTWNACVKLADCFWSLQGLPHDGLSGLGAIASNTSKADVCGVAAQNKDTNTFHRDCGKSTDIPASIYLRNVHINAFGASEGLMCNKANGDAETKLDKGTNHTDPRGDSWIIVTRYEIVGGRPENAFCLSTLLRIKDLSTLVLVSDKCSMPANIEPFKDAVEAITGKPTQAWIGATVGNSGAVVAMTYSEGGLPILAKPPSILTWGLAKNAEFQKWLGAVVIAASSSAILEEQGRPLKGISSEKTLEGRLMKWFSVFVARLPVESEAARETQWNERSKKLRDWMVRNVLTRKAEFKGTLLRVEKLK